MPGKVATRLPSAAEAFEERVVKRADAAELVAARGPCRAARGARRAAMKKPPKLSSSGLMLSSRRKMSVSPQARICRPTRTNSGPFVDSRGRRGRDGGAGGRCGRRRSTRRRMYSSGSAGLRLTSRGWSRRRVGGDSCAASSALVAVLRRAVVVDALALAAVLDAVLELVDGSIQPRSPRARPQPVVRRGASGRGRT